MNPNLSRPPRPTEPLVLIPHPRHYAWGGRGPASFLRRFLGRSQSAVPLAEAWFGAHPLGASAVAGSRQTLYDVLRRRVPRTPAGQSPLSFMAKIIEVRRPLSLQVHPAARRARRGFDRENRAGVSRDSADRSYRDPNAKPEYLVALTAFELFADWRPRAQWRTDRFCRAVLAGGAVPSTAGIRALVRAVTGWGPEEVRRLGRRVFSSAARSSAGRAGWLERIWREHGETRGDPAALLVPFMGYHRLKPGDGFFVPPGVAHTYLAGAGLEVMRSSDNVLRLGLTDKARRPAEARSALSMGARPRRVAAGAAPFSSNDFRVSTVAVAAAGRSHPLAWRGPALLIPTVRPLTIEIDGSAYPLPLGRGLFLPASGAGQWSAPGGRGWAGALVEGRFFVGQRI